MTTMIKGKLLRILESDRMLAHSGESISAELGVSRVTVWKHIQKLQELGYKIDSTPKGYQLHESPDTPFPWEMTGREESVFYYPELTSTMDVAKEMARQGAQHLSVIVAERQNKGRGRLSRRWVSKDGGLYFTVILRPQVPLNLAGRYNFAASVALVKVFRELYQVEAHVKWPNDILINEKKLCGMISEIDAAEDMVAFLNIGIGINVNNDPTPEEPNATSLCNVLGRQVNRQEILASFLDKFDHTIQNQTLDAIIEEWKEYTITLNRQVKIVTTRDTHEGRAVDIDEDGALILEQADNSLLKVVYGDCFHQTGD